MDVNVNKDDSILKKMYIYAFGKWFSFEANKY